MSSHDKTLRQVSSGKADANLSFADLCQLLRRLGFEERTKGSHHLFRRSGVEEKINLQKDDHHAKPYQVRQVRQLILKYDLAGDLGDG